MEYDSVVHQFPIILPARGLSVQEMRVNSKAPVFCAVEKQQQILRLWPMREAVFTSLWCSAGKHCICFWSLFSVCTRDPSFLVVPWLMSVLHLHVHASTLFSRCSHSDRICSFTLTVGDRILRNQIACILSDISDIQQASRVSSSGSTHSQWRRRCSFCSYVSTVSARRHPSHSTAGQLKFEQS